MGDNIKVVFKEIGSEVMNWFRVAQDRDQLVRKWTFEFRRVRDFLNS
jgi:hypothetical protein